MFKTTSPKADKPLCEKHLTLMTPWDQFPEKTGDIEWFCIDCLEEFNAEQRRQGKREVTLGAALSGKTEKEFFKIDDETVH